MASGNTFSSGSRSCSGGNSSSIVLAVPIALLPNDRPLTAGEPSPGNLTGEGWYHFKSQNGEDMWIVEPQILITRQNFSSSNLNSKPSNRPVSLRCNLSSLDTAFSVCLLPVFLIVWGGNASRGRLVGQFTQSMLISVRCCLS